MRESELFGDVYHDRLELLVIVVVICNEVVEFWEIFMDVFELSTPIEDGRGFHLFISFGDFSVDLIKKLEGY